MSRRKIFELNYFRKFCIINKIHKLSYNLFTINYRRIIEKLVIGKKMNIYYRKNSLIYTILIKQGILKKYVI